MTLAIAADHPAFEGHFPGRPIVPGVVLLDASLAAIAASIVGPTGCWRIGAAKFLSTIGPGEPLRLAFEPSTDGLSFRLRVYAGAADVERIAMTGSVGFGPA